MNNKVINKQISLEQIIRVADHLEDYKEKYDKKFELEENKNKNIPYGEKQWEYENGNTNIKYTIHFKNGKNITESDYNWFVGNLGQAKAINDISIDLYISYYTKSNNSTTNDIYNKVNISLWFREFDASIDIDTMNQENEAHNVYSEIMNILEDNEDRYNKTIKHRKVRIQSFCITIGIILSYVLYIALKMNVDKLDPFIAQYLDNKVVLLVGQWLVAILAGNVLSYWFMISIYKPLLPESKYAGYNSSTYRSVYKDDVDDFVEHSEIHFGKYWDAEKRRNKIEKIYKITSKIVLVQLAISVALFFILK